MNQVRNTLALAGAPCQANTATACVYAAGGASSAGFGSLDSAEVFQPVLSTAPECVAQPTDAGHVVTGLVPGSLTLSGGSWSVHDADIRGALSVAAGTRAVINHSSVAGAASAANGAAFSICDTTLKNGFTASGPAAAALCGDTVTATAIITNATGFVLVGDPGDDACAPNHFGSGLSLSGDKSGVEVSSNTVTGSVSLTNSGGTGPGADDVAPEIEGNSIGGGLSCSGNTPAPINDSTPNTVTGARSGQCASL
jgi:hypothetical protein